MKWLHSVAIAAAAFATTFAAAPAWAQQAKTTEQQARSYILSAFMTGAAPAVLSDDVKASPALRERLSLDAEADSRAIYLALVRQTSGKSFQVRPPSEDDLAKAEVKTEPGKPLFALDLGSAIYVMQYDLERDNVTYIADATRPVAVSSPITAPVAPQPIAEAPKPAPEVPVVAPAPVAPVVAPVAAPAAPVAPVAAPAAATPPPAPEPVARVQVVEPREPRFVKPPAAPAMSAPVQVTREAPRLPPLRPSGACVIKPVMSDQDLVNCGATPR